MIAHAWFAACAALSDEDTTALLSILQVLEAPEPSTEELTLALHELRHLNLWGRRYALPQVLRRLREVEPDSQAHRQVRAYLQDLASACLTSGPWRQLVEGLLQQRRGHALLPTLTACVESLPAEVDEPAADAPYLELADPPDSLLLLAALADRVQADPGDWAHQALAPAEGEEDTEEGGGQEGPDRPLRALLDRALGHQLGRMCFRLGLRAAAGGADDLGSEALLEQIVRTPSAVCDAEPDLVASAVEMLWPADGSSDPAELVGELLTEARSFQRFDQVRLERGSTPEAERRALERIGLPAEGRLDERMGDLARALWQVTLWRRAVETDPRQARAILADTWCRPVQPREATATLRHPLGSLRQSQLHHALRLRSIAACNARLPHIELEEADVTGIELAEPLGWVLHSPWLRTRAPREKSQAMFVALELNQIALLRLAEAARLGVRMLDTDEEAGPAAPDRVAMLRLLVHAAEVLDSVKRQIRRARDRKANGEAPTALPVLPAWLEHVRIVVEAAGRGSLPRLDPAELVALLDEPSGEDGDSQRFARSLPTRLARLASDACNAAVPGEPAARWLPHLARVCGVAMEDEQGRHYPDRMSAACVLRFLAPHHRVSLPDDLDWVRAVARDGSPVGWKTHHRAFLLQPHLGVDVWRSRTAPGWEEPDGPEAEARRLVRAIERLASLPSREAAEADPVLRSWLDEWRPLLLGHAQPQYIDRFVLFRLVEVLDAPALADAPEDQLAVVSALLEVGSDMVIHRMLERIYAPDRPGLAADQVRHATLSALVAVVERGAVEDDGTARSVGTRLMLAGRRRRLRAWLARLARDQRRGPSGATLRERARRARADLWAARARPQREVEARITSVDGYRHLVPLPGQTGFHHPQLRYAAIDETTWRALLAVDDHEPPAGAVDAFTDPQWRWADLSGSAVAVAHLLDAEVSDEGWKAAFHLGQGLCRRRTFDQAQALEVGTPVAVELFVDEHGPAVSKRRPPQPLPPRRAPGQHALVAQRPVDRPGQPIAIQELRVDGRRLPPSAVHGEDWRPDLARTIRSGVVPAVLDQDRRWRPAPGDLVDLLLAWPDDQEVDSLVFLRVDEGRSGRPVVVLSSEPGTSFHLGAEAFAPATWQALEAWTRTSEPAEQPGDWAYAGYADPPLVPGVRLRLRIADGPFPTLALTSSDEPAIGLDRVLLEWQDVFRPEGTWIAEREGDDWWIELPERLARAGFPPRARVSWARRRTPQADDRVAEVLVEDWIPWEAVAVAQPVSSHRVRGTDLEATVRDWLDLAEGARLQLDFTLGAKAGATEVPAFTRQGLPITVAAESLTTRPVRPGQDFRDRALCVEHVAQWVPVPLRNGDQDFEVDFGELPAEVLRDGRGRGIVVELPRPETSGSLWGIGWELPHGGVLRQALTALPAKDFRYRPALGQLVEVGRQGAAWRAVLSRRRVLARALWRLADRGVPLRDAVCREVRTAGRSGIGRAALVEVADGALAPGEGEGRPFPESGYVQPKSGLFGRQGHSLQRVLVRAGDEELAAEAIWPANGGPRGGLHDGRHHLGLGLRLVEEEDGLWTLRRQLDAPTPVVQVRPGGPRAAAVVSDETRDRFERAIAEGEVLAARYRRGTAGVELVRVVCPCPERADEPGWIRLLDGDRPFVHRAWGVDARVVLVQAWDGSPRASIRQVPPMTLGQWYQALGRPDPGEGVGLGTQPLYYVGPEPLQPAEPGGEVEVGRRFELAPGRTLLVPDRQIRFGGKAFSTASLVLINGDAVRRVTFTGQGEQLVLDIDRVAVRYGERRQLYRQRRDLRMVHLLRLESDGQRLRVLDVDGFDERSLESPLRRFGGAGAVISEERTSALVRALGRGTAAVLARLDEDRFTRTQGRELVFTPVSLGIGPSALAAALEEGERIFVRVRSVERTLNDYVIQLEPPEPLLCMEDLEISMLRRSLSVREELLRRMDDAGELAELEGKILLAKIAFHQGRLRAHVWDEKDLDEGARRLPRRTPAQLAGHLGQNDTPGLAAIMAVAHGGVLLELKPGVFVWLGRNRLVDTALDGLESGDIVEVEAVVDPGQGPRFRLEVAAYGDREAVPELGRPAAVLPLDELRKDWYRQEARRASDWNGHERFTVEDMPGLKARLGRWEPDRKRWGDLPWRAAVDLMQETGPRPGWLGPDDRGLRFDPCPAAVDPAGRVDLGGTEPEAVSLDGAKRAPLPLEGISFGDRDARNTVGRLKAGWWRVHDRHTVVWHGPSRASRPPVEDRRATTGPLFFQERRGTWRLRYSTDALERFGLPSRCLVSWLASRPDGATCFVAGVDSQRRALWLEMSPGRVARVPLRLAVRRFGPHAVRSLAELPVDAFSPGDEVKLTLAPAEGLGIDRVRFDQWRPGARGLIGSAAPQVLPLVRILERGGVELGAGALSLELPHEPAVDSAVEPGQAVLLFPTNHLSGRADIAGLCASGRQPAGLLVLDDEGQPRVAGLESLSVRRAQAAVDEPLAPWFRGDLATLRGLLAAVGGALPVTIEAQDETGTLWLSRRHQACPSLSLGSLLSGHVLGSLDDRTWLLRVGSWLLPVRPDAVVGGLPAWARAAAMASLAARRPPVWLHVAAEGPTSRAGALATGRGPVPPLEGLYRTIGHVEGERDGRRAGGYIALSASTGGLHWLAEEHASWVGEDLYGLAARTLAGPHRDLRGVSDGGRVLATAHPRARAELRELHVGQALVVEPLVAATGEHPGLARSSGAGIWLAWTGPGPDAASSIQARVVFRDDGDRPCLVATPLSEEGVHLAIPKHLGRLLVDPLEGSEVVPLAALLAEAVREARAGDRVRARFLIDELGRRALASLHLEALVGTWLGLPEEEVPTHGAWIRLAACRSALLDLPEDRASRFALTQTLVAACTSIEHRHHLLPDAQLTRLAAALRLAMGQRPASWDVVLDAAPRLAAVLALCRAFPRGATDDVPMLAPSTAEQLERLASGCALAPWPVLLLSPVPAMAPRQLTGQC